MALLGDTNGKAADVSFGIINMIKLFSVGIIAAATMVVPGVSGSMMLMLLGYYDTILKTINQFIDAVVAFDINGILTQCKVLIPFGIGIVIGIFLIAKLINLFFKSGDPCILCDHRSDHRIADRNFVKDRLECVLCCDIADRSGDTLRQDGLRHQN